MKSVINFIQTKKNEHLNDLIAFLRIPSISAKPEHKKPTAECALHVERLLKSAGLENVRQFPQPHAPGHPVVYGEWLRNPTAKTVLVYGHYDVQPVDPLNLWTNPPFEPTIRNGKVYARGATDDKGQILAHIKSVEAFLKTNQPLPVNVKFLIEGEEEVGSPNLDKFIESNRELLKCDVALISDTAMIGKGKPSIVYGLRGLTYMQVDLVGPNRDLHSGSFGGAVRNPINTLCEIIAGLKAPDGTILIPGFYDDVVPLTAEERENFKKLPFDEDEYKKELSISALTGENEYSPLERLSARPTLDCNGILGGYTETGAKTVLPARAMAKISMRLVPNQKTKKISELFTQYVRKLTPAGAEVTVTDLHGGDPVVVPLSSLAIRAGARALERAFGFECRFTREGGSIPVVATFKNLLGVDTVLMGFGLHSENAHSPDEHFDLEHFHKGIEASAYFFEALSNS